jgi:hypothetical protein
MKTRERAELLATALSECPAVVATSAEDLIAVVRSELGHADVLDHFVPHGEHYTRATPADPILHVIAGNTPAAGLQSLTRGLLLGANNLVKLPSAGLPEVLRFIDALPPALRSKLQVATQLPPTWMDQSQALIVFGSDSTIAEFRGKIRSGQTLLAYGHRVSLGLIFEDDVATARDAAHDVIVFDQLGCLSPHVFYVAGDAHSYAAALASCLAEEDRRTPRSAVALSVANAIRASREDISFRMANDEKLALWTSPGSTAWTVVYDETRGFPASPLHRFVFVKPLPVDLAEELAPVARHLSCAGIHPATLEIAERLRPLGMSRICPLGRMQQPPWTWHQEGHPTLGSLVRWVDFESLSAR